MRPTASPHPKPAPWPRRRALDAPPRESPAAPRAPRVNVLYVGMLPPHQGGSALMAVQVLLGLAAKGHRVRAIAPITSGGLLGGDPAVENGGIQVTRFVLPYLDTSPDVARN